jgi:hypothetical protein
VIKRYDSCRVYIGTYGNHRALWGIEVLGDFKIQAHSDAGSKVVYVNGGKGQLITPSDRNPETLFKDEYFCINITGENIQTCAYGFRTRNYR